MTLRTEFENVFKNWCNEGNHSADMTIESANWAFIQGLKAAMDIAQSPTAKGRIMEAIAVCPPLFAKAFFESNP